MKKLTVSLCSALVRHHLEYCVQPGAPALEECRDVGVGPKEDHADDQKAGTLLL